MTSKQRSYLKAMAHDLTPILYIGKEGITDGILADADAALEARELIKGSIQQNCELTCREAADALAEALGAVPVQSIGRKFVLFRVSKTNPQIHI